MSTSNLRHLLVVSALGALILSACGEDQDPEAAKDLLRKVENGYTVLLDTGDTLSEPPYSQWASPSGYANKVESHTLHASEVRVYFNREMAGVHVDTAHCAREFHCTDGFDNDLDGLPDCADPDCDVEGCEVGGEVSCADDRDNDGNGWIDCVDPACAGEQRCIDTACDCTDPTCATDPRCSTETNCTDGIDNNNKEGIDCDDPDCQFTAECAQSGVPSGPYMIHGDPALTEWPVGSIIVKEAFGSSGLAHTAVMEKQSAGEWFYAEYDSDGETVYSGTPDLCVSCHQGARSDHVFTADLSVLCGN